MYSKLALGAATVVASLAVAASPAMADTTVAIPLSFNHVVLDLPATGNAQLVKPSTAPLKVTAEVDTTTGAFAIDPSTFSAPAYHFTTPVAGSATLSLASPASGTINFATGALTMTGDFLADVNLGADGSCTIDTGSQTLTTSATKPLPGHLFPATATGAATGDGAFGVSWSTLPASTNGSGCTILNSVVDGPGGLWISRGISPVPALALSAAAKTVTVAAGKTASVKVTLANTGAADASSVKVCLAAKSPLKASACQTVKNPAAGSKRTLTFKVTTTKTTKAGSYKLTASSAGVTGATVTLKVTG